MLGYLGYQDFDPQPIHFCAEGRGTFQHVPCPEVDRCLAGHVQLQWQLVDGRTLQPCHCGRFGTAPSEEVVAAEYFAALSLAPGHCQLMPTDVNWLSVDFVAFWIKRNQKGLVRTENHWVQQVFTFQVFAFYWSFTCSAYDYGFGFPVLPRTLRISGTLRYSLYFGFG